MTIDRILRNDCYSVGTTDEGTQLCTPRIVIHHYTCPKLAYCHTWNSNLHLCPTVRRYFELH